MILGEQISLLKSKKSQFPFQKRVPWSFPLFVPPFPKKCFPTSLVFDCDTGPPSAEKYGAKDACEIYESFY